ncbi:MAG: K(+)-transporting ATPase subunit F [Leptospiraceae bacterium]|nr:K(+)-transporting ATPase subunit F [Leptospiraceae bacterium]
MAFSIEILGAAAIALVLSGYLVYTIIRPEKF